MLQYATFLAKIFHDLGRIVDTAGNNFQIGSFYWLLNRNIARQVARGMFHCRMSEDAL